MVRFDSANVSPTMPTDATLTELVARFRDASTGLDDWAAYERTVLADRELLRRAWRTSDDALAMALALVGMQPEREDELTVSLARALSFCPPLARLAERQERNPPGSNYNGPALFRLVQLVHASNQGLREARDPHLLARELAIAIRSVVPDLVAIEDRWDPGLAASTDDDRSRARFNCGMHVSVRSDPRSRGPIVGVAWSARYQCWTYRLEGDPTRRASEDLLVE